MEDFLRDTMQKDINGSPKIDERAFDTFSPHQKDMGKQASSQKDINTEFLNRPLTTVHKNIRLDETSDCNLQATKKSFEPMNKPNPDTIQTPQVKQGPSDYALLSELNKYKSMAEEYKAKNAELESRLHKLQFKQQDHQEVAPMSPSLMKIRYEILSKVHDKTSKSLKEENEGLKTLLLQYIPEDNYYK